MVASCGPELRRLSRSKPQLPGDCKVQSKHRVRFGCFAAVAHDGGERLPRLSQDLRSSADHRAGFQRQRSEKGRSEEHTSELQSRFDLVCRLLLEKKKNK